MTTKTAAQKTFTRGIVVPLDEWQRACRLIDHMFSYVGKMSPGKYGDFYAEANEHFLTASRVSAEVGSAAVAKAFAASLSPDSKRSNWDDEVLADGKEIVRFVLDARPDHRSEVTCRVVHLGDGTPALEVYGDNGKLRTRTTMSVNVLRVFQLEQF